jgi:hypothetical protein
MMIMNLPCSIAIAVACIAAEKTLAQLSSVAARKRLRHGRHSGDVQVFGRPAIPNRLLEMDTMDTPLVFSAAEENQDPFGDSMDQPVETNSIEQTSIENMLSAGEKCISDVQGCASSSVNWLASLPHSRAIDIMIVGIVLFFVLLCLCCCCKRKSISSKDTVRIEDEPCFDTEGAASLSYVGQAVHSTLQKYHGRHKRTMWNLTSGRIVGQLDYTPRGVWDTSSEPGEVHDYWFPEKLAKIIGRTEAWWCVKM